MHTPELILTLTVGLTAATLAGFLALRLKLPPIVGYLVAGILLGPHTPGFVADRAMADQFAEVGVILLMFGVGLHFHVKDLLAVRTIALTGALTQISVATLCGALAGRAFGWTWPASLIFGVALSVASTVVLIRVLSDHNELHSDTGRAAIGWLVVEDLFTVFVLVLLPVFFPPPGGSVGSLPVAIGFAVVKLGLLAVLTFSIGGRLIPRVLSAAAATRSRELFTLTVLVIALGIAVGSAAAFGVSMALGAFLAGMVVGQSKFSSRAASEALPMRDAFAVLFFVSAGMLLNPAQILRDPFSTAVTCAIVLIAKPAAAYVIVRVLGRPHSTGVKIAVALAQVGEFSFILAAMAVSLGILPDSARDAIVAASILSISINPFLYRLTPKVAALPAPAEPCVPVLIAGYGPIGQALSSLLQRRGLEPVVIERNPETVRRLEAEGVRVVSGDAGEEATLRAAGIDRARALILSFPGSPASAALIAAARALNPTIRILARSSFLNAAPALRDAGASEVFASEAEVARAITESILNDLGATPEQMDEERARLRDELYRGQSADAATSGSPI